MRPAADATSGVLPPAIPPGIERVREFWNENPLFSGVGSYAPGEKAFFEEHERVMLHDHSGKLHPIFTRDIAPGASVLDVGCGIGFWVHQFLRLGASVSACDLTERAVSLTRSRLELFDLSADVRVGNAEELPYADASFDHINCQGVIHHTPNTQQCIAEFWRVLKPGGTLCFSVYYRVLPLRSKVAYAIVTRLARPWVRMRGRGRENMLLARTPDDLVRLYDGLENPIGKAYTRAAARALLTDRFRVLEDTRFGLPRQAIGIRVPDWAIRPISHQFGLMIALRCAKL